MHIIDFTDPEYRELVEQKIRSGDEGLYETVCLRKDGTRFPSDIQSQSHVLWWAYHQDDRHRFTARKVTWNAVIKICM